MGVRRNATGLRKSHACSNMAGTPAHRGRPVGLDRFIPGLLLLLSRLLPALFSLALLVPFRPKRPLQSLQNPARPRARFTASPTKLQS